MIGKILFQNTLNFKYVIQVTNILHDLSSICIEIVFYSQKPIKVDLFMQYRAAIS